MVRVFKITNAYNPQDGLEQLELQPGVLLSVVGADYENEPWLCVAYLGGKQFFPLREEWDEITLEAGDIVYFMPRVAGTVALIILSVIAIAAVVVALSINPPESGNSPEPAPVYDLTGQRNQNRLGKPIEDGYGECVLWPSYATRTYNQYYGNDQFQFQLLCLGHGSWETETPKIEDTSIDQFEEVEWAIYEPGEQVTLFPDNVETSVEVGRIELYGPNEPEFIGKTGPFVANSIGTLTEHLEVDIVLPNGLFASNDDGSLDEHLSAALFEYREIDDAGAAIGDWVDLATFTKILQTNTPQRYTLQKDVPSGRYEVRASRTNNSKLSHRYGDKIEWVGLRAFLKSTRDYGDVTMLAVKARATNNLNDAASNRINIRGVRKLPSYDHATNTLTAFDDVANRTATRSPIWAMVNILRAPYGGNLEDRFLDLEFFGEEALVAENAGIFFDWVYDQRGTVWEALKLPCFVNRAIPMLNGSRVSFIRDKPQSQPSFFINPENTFQGSFKIEKKLFDLQEYDGLEVEYTDGATWKPEIVLCLLPGQAGNNLKRIRLNGVTDRQRAFDLGMFLWFKESKEREQVTVKTGLEGYIPTYGDLGRFGSDIPRWGESGVIENISANEITLSEPVTFIDGEVHQLAIRGKCGQDLGPFTVVAGDAPNKVISQSALPEDEMFFDFNNEPPFFIFGVSNLVGRVCRIVELNPDGEGVTLKGVVDNQGRHADFGIAPELNQPAAAPSVPDAPIVPSIVVVPVPSTTSIVTVSWEPAFGAVGYILQQSENGVDWVDVDTVNHTNYTLPVVPGTLFVRVAAFNVGIGPFVSWNGAVGQATGIPGDVSGLVTQPAFTGTSCHLRWSSATQAVNYEVKVFTGGVLRCTEETIATDFDFTIDEAIACGGVNRVITFEVRAKNSFGVSATAATTTETNPIPAKITSGLSSVLLSDTGTVRTHRVSWPIVPGSDISFYRVWGSETAGFTPGAGNVLFEGLATGADLQITDTGSGFPTLYWRVAAVDLWGDDTNPSDEQTI